MLKAAAVAALSHDAQRLEYVNQLNSMGLTWTAGVSARFRGEPLGASKPLCGVKEDNLEKMKEAILAGEIEVSEAPDGFAPPESFDSATNWPSCAKVIDDIRDQSNCGCCWAFGGASAASDRLCIATNASSSVPLSAEAVCFCGSTDGCGGGFLQATWGYVKRGAVTGGNQADTGPLGGGFCSEFSLPHCHHHGPQGSDPYPAEGTSGCPTQSSPKCPKQCDSTAKAPHNDFSKDHYKFTGSIQSYGNEAAIQNAIMTAGPVETAFTVYQDFENYVSGVYKKTSSTVLGGHAVRIVGWGVDGSTKYWKVANSWNPFWGEKGYFRIVRGTDECGIESQGMANGAGSWVGPTIF
jgi:cathepsin B